MINKIYERALRLILNDYASDFDNNETCNRHRNIQTLMVKIYKTKNNLNFPVMNFMFERRNNTYNLRHFQVYDEKKKNCENES